MSQLKQLGDLISTMETDRVASLPLREPIKVTPATILRGAIAMMRYRQLGCAVIVEHGQPVGIFTERSVLELLTKNASLDELPVQEFADGNFHQVQLNDSVSSVWNAIRDEGRRFVCVVDDHGKLIGLTGQRGMSEYVAELQDKLTTNGVTKAYCEFLSALDNSTVDSMETCPFAVIESTASIRRAVYTLHGLQVASLLVVDDDRLVGIITERDILERVAERYDKLAARPIRDVMTADPLVVYESDPNTTALRAIAKAGYRHVPVLNDSGNVVGIVSPRRIFSFLDDDFRHVRRN